MAIPHLPSEPGVYFLVGATAVGKTAVTQWIAERQDCEILSADSMQVYRGMDIGTAKPSRAEQARARYHGLDLADSGDRFSVGQYRTLALTALAEAARRGHTVLVVGGTGLYIKSLTDGLAPRAPANADLRARAEQLYREQGLPALQNVLRRKNPALYASLRDPQNPRRLIRALEWAEAPDFIPGGNWRRGPAGLRIPGLILPPAQLYDAIVKRVHAMYAAGLAAEAQGLVDHGLASAPTARQAIGYAEVTAYLNGQCTLEAARELTIQRTRQLAKRQMTWFRHQAQVDWLAVDLSMPVEERARLVLEYWLAHGPTPIAS